MKLRELDHIGDIKEQILERRESPPKDLDVLDFLLEYLCDYTILVLSQTSKLICRCLTKKNTIS